MTDEDLDDVTDPGAGANERVARNVLVVVAAELAGKVATLVFTIVVARQLGETSFGAFAYALSFGLLAASFPSWGFDTVLLRRGSAERRDLAPALAITLALRTVLAVPVLLLGVVAAVLTRPSAATTQAVVLVLVAAVLDTYGDAGRAAAGALEKRGRTSVALVAQRIGAAVFAGVALEQGAGLVGVCIAYLASSLLGQALTLRAMRRLGVRAEWSAVTRESLLLMWRDSFYIGIDTLVSMALFRIDALMLGGLRGDRELGHYAVAYRLLETVLFVNWAVSRSVLPMMSREDDDRRLLRITEQGLAAVAVVLIPYGTLLLCEGQSLLRLLFGGEFDESSVESLRWLAAAPLTFGIAYFGSYALLARARNRELLISSAIAAGFNIALNLVLIPPYGDEGAAFATTASFLVEGLVTMGYLRRYGWLRVDRALVLPAAASAVMAAVLVALRAPLAVELVVGVLVFAAAYVPMSLRWAPEQLDLLRSLRRRS